VTTPAHRTAAAALDGSPALDLPEGVPAAVPADLVSLDGAAAVA
jgi:hypothetical protein